MRSIDEAVAPRRAERRGRAPDARDRGVDDGVAARTLADFGLDHAGIDAALDAERVRALRAAGIEPVAEDRLRATRHSRPRWGTRSARRCVAPTTGRDATAVAPTVSGSPSPTRCSASSAPISAPCRGRSRTRASTAPRSSPTRTALRGHPDGRTPTAGWAVEADGLVKSFGDTRAVDGVDLRVATGSVYGVLGPNGAGKTTTISMLATLARPDAGTARVFGHDVVREPQVVRQLIGLTGQFASLDEMLSGTENLVLFSRSAGLWAGRRPGARLPSSSRSSGWGMPRRSPSPSTPAACDAASTSRPASSPSRR